MKHFSHLNTAAKILTSYKGQQPFGLFIKDFFKGEKKYGSRDRKQIAHLCYCYFRLGKALTQLPVEERIVLGLFLSSSAPVDLLQLLKPEWNQHVGLPVSEKNKITGHSFSSAAIFPFEHPISEGLDREEFALSHLRQPDLFIRLRPGHETQVEQKLGIADIKYQKESGNCLALPNGTKIENILQLNKEAVVQDLNSQRVGEFLQLVKQDRKAENQGMKVWDCCAASGGKSIMAVDILDLIELSVSDIRESILFNLRRRFEEAGIKNYHSFVSDLSSANYQGSGETYELIIADLPCSGSGTWGRTPEQLYYFQEERIEEYAALQKRIVQQVVTSLSKGGYLLYVTCSVFKDENEAIVDYLRQHCSLHLKKMELFTGYDKKADTLFAALLQRSL